MANVPQAHPEPQIVPLRDLPPVRTTANGKRKSPPPSEAEKTMLAELAELRADGEGPAAPETTTAPRQRDIPIKRPAPHTCVRVDRDWTFAVFLYQPSRGIRDPYVVSPAIVSLLEGKAKQVDLRLAVDPEGVVFFWPSPRGEEFPAHITERDPSWPPATA